MGLDGKIALVTGGASGIGAAVARRLAADGARVFILDSNGESALAVAGDIGALAAVREVDVTDAASVRQAVDDVAHRHGAVDIVVNSAGVLLNKPFLDISVEEFERVVRVNLTGSFVVAQAAARTMIGRGGRIIHIASAGGILGFPGRAAYAASKGGIIALTRVMAIELAQHGILVNAVAPGPVPTPMAAAAYDSRYRSGLTRQVPLNRYATPEEIAEVVGFLASPASSYITGQTIAADGGMSISGLTCHALAE